MIPLKINIFKTIRAVFFVILQIQENIKYYANFRSRKKKTNLFVELLFLILFFSFKDIS